MASTTFVDYNTPIVAAWLNDLNTAVYTAIGTGTVAPTTPAAVRTNLGLTAVGGAALIGNTAAGGITSATVQAALNELDTKKALLAGSASQAFSTSTLASTAISATSLVSTGDVTCSSLNGGQLSGLRNRIINGAMKLSQWGSSATVVAGTAVPTASTGYPCVDRFFVYCTGANVTAAQGAGSLQSQRRLQITGAASVTAMGVGQRIEQANSYDLNGTTATLSVDLANNGLTTVTWTASYATSADTFGTIGTPTKTQIATGTFTVSATIARFTAQIAVPAAAITGIEILFTVGAQTAGAFTVGNVQLEPGVVATPFEQRPIGMELALCQRYCWKGDGGKTYNQAAGAATVSSSLRYPVTLRAIPTVTLPVGTVDFNTIDQMTSHNSIASGTWYDQGTVLSAAEL